MLIMVLNILKCERSKRAHTTYVFVVVVAHLNTRNVLNNIIVPRRHHSVTPLQGITKWFYLFYEFAVFGRMKEKQNQFFCIMQRGGGKKNLNRQ